MLKKMIIKNFKCFKKETEFDFKKTNYKLLKQNTCGKILKGALFVGDNASGKTTAIQPLKLLLDLLFKDTDIDLRFYQCFFSEDNITSLHFSFEIGAHEIIYFFSFAENSFLEEKLTVDNQTILERIGKNGKFLMGDEVSYHDIDQSLLFLKRVYFNTKFTGNDILIQWFTFLKKSIYINSYSRQIITFGGESLVLKKYIEANSMEKINGFLEENRFDYSILCSFVAEKKEEYFELDEDEGKLIFFERTGIDVPIPLFMESTGNQTLINILPAILCAVERGGMLIIDEFSSGLHNKLEELLVKYIMKYGLETQLFFVSHSTNLLSNSILRPDQIYAVEMAGEEGSILKRFSDEQPRVAQNLEKMYLSGVFGGIPEYGTDQK